MIDDLPHEYTGHERPGTAQRSAPQPATNIDGFRYLMDRFSTLVPAAVLAHTSPSPFSTRRAGATASGASERELLRAGLIAGGGGLVVGALATVLATKVALLHARSKSGPPELRLPLAEEN